MHQKHTKTTALRGRVVTFDRGQAYEPGKSPTVYSDGYVLIRNGKVLAIGEYRQDIEADILIDHRPHIITAGFIDAHLHMPQTRIVGAYAPSLLEWLNEHTFVEEQNFSNPAHAQRIAVFFFDELIRNGTTTAAAYCTVHPASVNAFFEEARRRNMLMLGGKVMMDRNAPAGLLDTPQDSYDHTKKLIDRWHLNGRSRYVISPRFAITSTPEQMEVASALVREFPDLHVQTHVDESRAEIEFACSLYPGAKDYLGIYEDYGLLGPKMLLGHCIHLTLREVEVLQDSRSVAVWCPTSNLFLGSGLFEHSRLSEEGVTIAVATDVGAGTSFSMLRTMDEAYKITQLHEHRLHPFDSLYRMTLGNARALGLEDRIGSIAPGNDADIVVLDAWATPQMSVRMETVSKLEDEIFLLQTCGDDRAVVQTYVAGVSMKIGAAANPYWRPSRPPQTVVNLR